MTVLYSVTVVGRVAGWPVHAVPLCSFQTTKIRKRSPAMHTRTLIGYKLHRLFQTVASRRGHVADSIHTARGDGARRYCRVGGDSVNSAL